MTTRLVVLVSDDQKGERYAIPFANYAKAEKWVMEHFRDREGFRRLDNAWNVIKEWATDDCTRVWIVKEDPKGLFIGLDSSDRDNFIGNISEMKEGDDYYGDADAYIFETVGKPANIRIDVTRVV